MKRAAPILIASLAGCYLGVRLAVAFPDLGDARAVIVALRSDDALIVEAHDRDDIPIRLLASGTAIVEILGYPNTLAELGIASGPLRSDPDGERLPTPDTIYEARVENETVGAWEPREAMSRELGSFLVKRSLPECTRFQIVAQHDDVPFSLCAFEYGGDIYAGGQRGIFRLTVDGAEPVATDPPDIQPSGAAVDPMGRLLISDRGTLLRGDLSRLDPITTSTAGQVMSWIAPGENIVHSMSQYGVIERFDGSESHVLYRFPFDHTLGAGIARHAEDEAVAVHQLYGSAVRGIGTQVDVEALPDAEETHLSAAVEVPGLGTVIGSEDGRFFVSDGGLWRELDHSPYALRVLAILPTPEGFLYAGELGTLGEYRRDIGFCPTEVIHPGSIFFLLESDGLLYVLNRGNDGVATLIVLRRV